MNRYIDIYCERLEPGLWAEPLNLISNLAFILAAIYVYPRIRHDKAARRLAIALFAIGIGSALFHGFATVWGSMLDVLAILIYILIYIYHATQRLVRPGAVWGGIAAISFFPFAALATPALTAVLGDLNGSVSYLPVWIMIAAYGLIAPPDIRKGLWIGCAILAASLLFRSIDMAVCPTLTIGTHYIWHILNGIMLGWMILVMARMAPVAPDPAQR